MSRHAHVCIHEYLEASYLSLASRRVAKYALPRGSIVFSTILEAEPVRRLVGHGRSLLPSAMIFIPRRLRLGAGLMPQSPDQAYRMPKHRIHHISPLWLQFSLDTVSAFKRLGFQ